MKLTQLVNPIVLFAVALRRKISRQLPLDYGEAKRTALGLFNRIEAEAARLAMTDRWNRAKKTLVYLIDEIAIMSPWAGAEMWNNQSLEVEYLGHSEKMRGVWFYDQEYKHALETGDADLLEIVYLCLCLGFEGKFRGQTAQLKNHVDNVYARLPIPYRDERERRLFPGAYHVDLTANDPKLPIRVVTVATIFVGILLTYFVVNFVVYESFVGDLRGMAHNLLGG